MVADHAGYDNDRYIYYKHDLGFQLVCPFRRYRNTPSSDRLKPVDFYESVLGGQVICSKENYVHRTTNRPYQVNI
jgi:hypothetical protein